MSLDGIDDLFNGDWNCDIRRFESVLTSMRVYNAINHMYKMLLKEFLYQYLNMVNLCLRRQPNRTKFWRE